ncbi:MAG: glycosyltransferase family 4 protein [Bacteroidales bacterium]
MNKVSIAVVGDVLDINCWSSTPYYFFTVGARHGIFHIPWRLQLDKLKLPRYYWNAQQFLLHGNMGGFQYSPYFLNLAEQQIPASHFASMVISFNQLFPRASTIIKHGGKIYYYLDATLHDLFHSPAYKLHVPVKVRQQAIAQEFENYQRCEGVVTMGRWIHKTLREIYQVPQHKLFHILPGANLELPSKFQFNDSAENPQSSRLILGFVGKDWQRKGLLLVYEVQQILQKKGYDVIIKIIGSCPDELLRKPGIAYCGFIHKQTDTERFVKEIASCDIGCLFSADEALGISVLEFLRVGVPVAGFFHQGMKDTLMEGASFRFRPNATAENIAHAFEQYILDTRLRKNLKQKAMEYSTYVTWDRCVTEWKQLLIAHHALPEG